MHYLRRIVKVLYFNILRILRYFEISLAKRDINCLAAKSDEIILEELEKYGYISKLESAEKVISGIKNADVDENTELSIIVPIYNAQRYIDTLCKSLLNQKTKYTYEVIFVDDGSKDNSFELLSAWAEKDSKARVFSKENGGISSARNYGIDMAVGKYLLFVDNDDYLSDDFVEKTLDAANKENADIVKTAHLEFDPDNHQRPLVMSETVAIKGYMGESLTRYNGYVWGTVYSRKVWENVRFPLGAWYEDMITRLILFRKGNGFVYIDKPMYFYFVHASNASKILWSNKNIKALDQLFLTKWMIEYTDALGIKADEWTYKIVLEELGVYLYSRILQLDSDIVKTAFLSACNFVESRQVEVGKLSKTEALLLKSFKTRNFKLYKAVCSYVDCERRLK